MKILVACEESQAVCIAFREKGHEAYSCDLKPCSGGHSEWHIQDDAIKVAYGEYFDMMIAHPVCKRLTNSFVRWLYVPPKGKTLVEVWCELYKAADFYIKLRNAPIKKKALENPVFHPYAKIYLGDVKRQIVQPHYFGDPFFKATGFELIGLSELKRTHWMTIPKKGTEEHKKWSYIHRLPPGPDRETLRSKTFPGIAAAMASQWSCDKICR